MAELSDRKKKILSSVIELYIKTGEPVGSKGLISYTGMTVSSATVRNEMNELDSLGFLEQPHTSAGRVPTQQGYRYYLDHLMKEKSIDDVTKRIIDAGISPAVGDPERLVERARDLMVDLTKYACISTAPIGEETLLRRIELVPVGPHTLMMVLLTSNGILKSRLCRLDEINIQLLEKFRNISDSFFIGKAVGDINLASLQTIAFSVGDDYFSILPLMAAVSELAGSTADSRMVLGGTSNLLSLKDYGNNAVSVLDFLNKKEPFSQVIKSSKGNLDVHIGTENRFKQLKDSSVIVSKYSVNGDTSGSISIVGPTRMNYETIIPSIRYLSDLVGELISQALDE
ncbi:MAG: heat-inducible transcriptional repressor HrcA [Clostridia bacterium]|nr:heat-inducible transcriptional repressor HrcA [Clostridia bacterium]